jgi:hypothetical protein
VGTGTLNRQANAESRLTAEQLGQRISVANDEVLPSLLIGARAMLINALAQGENGPNIAPLLAALETKYATWSPQMRLLAVLELPAPGEIPALATWGELTKKEIDPAIAPWVLLTRVGSPEDPFITTCEQSGDPALARLATITRDRLTKQTKTYAVRGAMGVISAAEPAKK